MPVHIVPILRELCRAIQAQQPASLARSRAMSHLFEIAQGRFIAYATRRSGGSPELAEDAVGNAFLHIVGNACACRALEGERAASHSERMAWKWCFSCLRTHIRRLRDQRDDEGGTIPEPPPPDELFERDEVLAQAWDLILRHTRELIATGEPSDLRTVAKHMNVGSTPEALERQLTVWREVRVNGRSTLSVGRELEYPGTDPQVRNRVSQQVRRGAAALACGATRAQLEPLDGYVRAAIVRIAVLLAVPLKSGRAI